MDGNDDNRLAKAKAKAEAAKKECMQDSEKRMNMWFGMMHDLYLKLSSILLSLSVVAIGFALSYLLENEYHSGKYETCVAKVTLGFLFFGLFLLLASCFCGIMHLYKNLAFVQCNANHFAARYTEDATIYYQGTVGTHTGQEEKCTSPSPLWWYGQLCLFSFGVAMLVAWGAIDFLMLVR